MMGYVRQAGRTVAHTFDFEGRASRSEFLGFVVLSQLPLVAAHWTTTWFAPARVADAILLAAVFVISAPLFGLCVRRLHDFGRSGRWSAPLLILLGRALLLDLIGLTAGWPARSVIESALSYIDWMLTIPAAAVFVALLAWPPAKERAAVIPADAPLHSAAADGI